MATVVRPDQRMEAIRRRVERVISNYLFEASIRTATTVTGNPALVVNVSSKYHRGSFDGLTYATMSGSLVRTVEQETGFEYDGVVVLKREGQTYPVLTASFKKVFIDLKGMGDYLEQFVTNDGRSE